MMLGERWQFLTIANTSAQMPPAAPCPTRPALKLRFGQLARFTQTRRA
jgi:hypothetical protein